MADTLTKLPKGMKILDAGAGEQIYRRYCEHLEYVSHDFGEYDGTGDGAAFHLGKWDTADIDVVGDICNLPIKDNEFDAVLCTEVLEHVYDPITAVKELKRVLRPGGTIIITAPFRSYTHFSPHHYCDGFNRYFFNTHFSDFETVELRANGSFFDSFAEQIWLLRPISRRYSNGWIGFVTFLIMLTFIPLLKVLKNLDKGSSEFSNYGHFFIGRKTGG